MTEPEPISEAAAIERFHPERLKRVAQTKVSKTAVQLTRWESRLPGTSLAIIRHAPKKKDDPKFEDLCWLNGKVWTYITTNKI